MRQAKLPDAALRHGKQAPEIRADFTHLLRVRDNHEAVEFAEHVQSTTRKQHQKRCEEGAIDGLAHRHDARAGSVSEIKHI